MNDRWVIELFFDESHSIKIETSENGVIQYKAIFNDIPDNPWLSTYLPEIGQIRINLNQVRYITFKQA